MEISGAAPETPACKAGSLLVSLYPLICECSRSQSFNPQEIMDKALFLDTLGMDGFQPPPSHICSADIVTFRDPYSVEDFIHNGRIRTYDLISVISRLGLGRLVTS